MVAVWKIFPKFLAIFVVILVFWDGTEVEARRGGGARFRVRVGRNRGGGIRTRRSGMGSGTYWKTAAAVGTIYGLTRYKRRRAYYSNRNRSPTICRNEFDHTENYTKYTQFICPMMGQPESYNYCCGPNNRQTCCQFKDSPGRIAGVIIGVLVMIIIIGLIVYCCCCRKRGAKGTTWSTIRKSKSSSGAKRPDVKYSAAPAPPVPMTPMPPQPVSGYPANPPPGSVPSQPGYPVGPQPGAMPGAAPPYAPQPAYPPQPYGNPAAMQAPYPPQPTGPTAPYGEKPPYPPGDAYPPPAGPPAYSSAGAYPPAHTTPYPPQ